MTAEPIITVENLGKRYSLSHLRDQRYIALRDVVVEKATRLFRRRSNSRSQAADSKNPTSGLGPLTSAPAPETREDFWALRNVSFEVRQGEVVGIIGRNGAGKSTLLKILSRITEPTEGRVTLRGRVASLLEVGTGFHPELTGRENIYLNGAILGMARAEIQKKFDEIIAFAEVEKFLDTPVKRYSSGMYVRLAFAVAAHLEPEILVIDEVLAVGDAEFQKKCLGKMEDVARGEGRTVLFVSHDMAAIEHLCRSAIVLDAGKIVFIGAASDGIREYLQGVGEASLVIPSDIRRSGSGEVRFSEARISIESRSVRALITGASATFELHFQKAPRAKPDKVRIDMRIDTLRGQRLLLLSSHLTGDTLVIKDIQAGLIRLDIPSLPLLPGLYSVTIFCMCDGVVADWIPSAFQFEVVPGNFYSTGNLPPAEQGTFVARHKVRVGTM